ncbi:MAG: type II secretion system F family protein [Butyrivibrio sp.]|nr:type II secretion system F family protein [Butyrivibrio sp.]
MNLNILKNYFQQALHYRLTKEDLIILLKGTGLCILLGYTFYNSVFAVIIMLPAIIPFFVYQKRKIKEKACKELGIQFKDAILSVTTAGKAGYSIENAFNEAVQDMLSLYGKNSLIYKEMKRITIGLKNNLILEDMLTDLGERSGNMDIQEFAAVFAVAKRSGGNMTEILNSSIRMISRRIDVEKEIDVLIASKRMETRIMEAVPFFIILYVSATNKGFFEPLYANVLGKAVMTVCMVIYIAAVYMAEKIIDIEI